MSTTMDGVAYLDCGHDAVPEGIGTGVAYMTDDDGERWSMCYKCARIETMDAIKLTGIEIEGKTEWRLGSVYMSSDGRTVTTWDGQLLGHVTHHGRLHNWAGDGSGRHYIHVVIKEGADVVNAYGTGARGEYCSLRRRKSDIKKTIK
jgi:hypothetical protein